MTTHRFDSKSSSRVYEVQDHGDGTATCNCPAWIYKRQGQARGCRHTAEVLGQPVPKRASRTRKVQPQPAYVTTTLSKSKAVEYADKVYQKLVQQGRSEEDARRDASRWVSGNFGQAVA